MTNSPKYKIAFLFALIVASVGLCVYVNADVKYVGSIQRFTGESSDTKPTYAPNGSEFYERNSGLTYIFDTTDSTWDAESSNPTTSSFGDSTTISAPGNSPAISTSGYPKGGYLFEITNINTTVSLALQGRANDSPWVSIGTDSTQYTSNKGAGLVTTNAALYDSLRLSFIAESGGTAANITYTPVLGGP